MDRHKTWQALLVTSTSYLRRKSSLEFMNCRDVNIMSYSNKIYSLFFLICLEDPSHPVVLLDPDEKWEVYYKCLLSMFYPWFNSNV